MTSLACDPRATRPEPGLRFVCEACDVRLPLTFLNASEIGLHMGHACTVEIAAVFVDVDPNAPHDEDCGFWHGGACTCNAEMREALDRHHCHECNYLHGSGYNRCNCGGFCICERLPGCPCIGHVPVKEAA
jgi:hypothetical protein